jgi:hypothetical protein
MFVLVILEQLVWEPVKTAVDTVLDITRFGVKNQAASFLFYFADGRQKGSLSVCEPGFLEDFGGTRNNLSWFEKA